jgi:hypothetical protein
MGKVKLKNGHFKAESFDVGQKNGTQAISLDIFS